MPRPMNLQEFLELLDWPVLRDEFEGLVQGGTPHRLAARSVARAVDALLPLDGIIPGTAGKVAEHLDGPALRVSITLILLFSERGK